MPRKRSITDNLITLPWWLNLLFSVIAYSALKYVLPALEPQSSLFKALVNATPHIAPIAASLLILIAALSAFHAWRKGELLNSQTSLQTIQNLSWKDFEYLISEAYRRQGYSVQENHGGGADGGIDLRLKKDGKQILVQCKNWRSQTVAVSTVRELYGVMASEGAEEGVIACSGRYTSAAKNFAKDKPITLIGDKQLIQLIGKLQTTPKIKAEPEITCPTCGSTMVHRVAKRGKNSGQPFWGCERFPKCRGTRPHPQTTNPR